MWFAGCSSSPVRSTYVCSLSSRTIVYKGMFLVRELRQFYPDLQDEDYETAIGMVHSRFSTNTNPPAGTGPTPTASFSTTARSTPSGATWTRMLAREETIVQPLLEGRYEQGAARLSIRAVPTPPCWITPWNSWS